MSSGPHGEVFVLLRAVRPDAEDHEFAKEQLESRTIYPTILSANQAAYNLLNDTFLPIKATSYAMTNSEAYGDFPTWEDGIEDEMNRDSETHFYSGAITLGEEEFHRIRIRVIGLNLAEGGEFDSKGDEESKEKKKRLKAIERRVYELWDEENIDLGEGDERENEEEGSAKGKKKRAQPDEVDEGGASGSKRRKGNAGKQVAVKEEKGDQAKDDGGEHTLPFTLVHIQMS